MQIFLKSSVPLSPHVADSLYNLQTHNLSQRYVSRVIILFAEESNVTDIAMLH